MNGSEQKALSTIRHMPDSRLLEEARVIQQSKEEDGGASRGVKTRIRRILAEGRKRELALALMPEREVTGVQESNFREEERQRSLGVQDRQYRAEIERIQEQSRWGGGHRYNW